jgi:hypothetical protein
MEARALTESSEPKRLAMRAAEIAVPFADLVAASCADVASSLRRGEDHGAMTSLTESTVDLEDFLKFLVLIRDFVADLDAGVGEQINAYQRRLMTIIEGLQQPLGSMDFVEIADTLDEDLVPCLRGYRELDGSVQAAVAGSDGG